MFYQLSWLTGISPQQKLSDYCCWCWQFICHSEGLFNLQEITTKVNTWTTTNMTLISRLQINRKKWNAVGKNVVVLHQIQRGKHTPSISPFPLKLETYLRMANIPYEVTKHNIVSKMFIFIKLGNYFRMTLKNQWALKGKLHGLPWMGRTFLTPSWSLKLFQKNSTKTSAVI